MPTKEEIFDNITTYTVEEIVGYIKSGIVTVPELEDPENTGGQYSSEMRDRVNFLLSNQEPIDWQRALDLNTIEGYQYYLDTYPDGLHREEARTKKRELQNLAATKPETPKTPLYTQPDEWDAVDKTNLDALKEFVKNHKNSPHYLEAQQLIFNMERELLLRGDINSLIEEIVNIRAGKNVINPDVVVFKKIVAALSRHSITKEELLSALEKDKNLLSTGVVNQLLESAIFCLDDLRALGISDDFLVHLLKNEEPPKFDDKSIRALTSICKPSTEIYFWGIPSSGKTCALGAILGCAEQLGSRKSKNSKFIKTFKSDSACQGTSYMEFLIELFQEDDMVRTLPGGTDLRSTYEMGFDLTDMYDLIHPITCIDLAGELIRCMYKCSTTPQLLNEDEIRTLDTITNILKNNRTKNRKIHFFVIEYGAEKHLYDGLTQDRYLYYAVDYLKNYEIFQKDTDAIYILLTKADKIPRDNRPLNEIVSDYLKKEYENFSNSLKEICKMYEINDKNLEAIPFSLGTVCFQRCFKFDGTAAESVLRVIIDRTKGFKHEKLQKFLDNFSK